MNHLKYKFGGALVCPLQQQCPIRLVVIKPQQLNQLFAGCGVGGYGLLHMHAPQQSAQSTEYTEATRVRTKKQMMQ